MHWSLFWNPSCVSFESLGVWRTFCIHWSLFWNPVCQFWRFRCLMDILHTLISWNPVSVCLKVEELSDGHLYAHISILNPVCLKVEELSDGHLYAHISILNPVCLKVEEVSDRYLVCNEHYKPIRDEVTKLKLAGDPKGLQQMLQVSWTAFSPTFLVSHGHADEADTFCWMTDVQCFLLVWMYVVNNSRGVIYYFAVGWYICSVINLRIMTTTTAKILIKVAFKSCNSTLKSFSLSFFLSLIFSLSFCLFVPLPLHLCMCLSLV